MALQNLGCDDLLVDVAQTFFFKKSKFTLDFCPKSKYNTYYELKKERVGAVQARGKQAEEGPRGGAGDGWDAVFNRPWYFRPLPDDAQGGRQDEDDLCASACRGGGRGLDWALASGARAAEGIERILAPGVSWTPGEARNEEVGPWGQRKFEFRGRRPAKGPDYEEALKALRGFLEPFRNVLNPLLVGLVDAEYEEKCVYSTLTVVWTVILGFLQHLRSRNAMDAERETKEYSMSVFDLSEQPYDPQGGKLHTACSETCRKRLSKAETAKLEGALVGMVRYLVRGKWFRDAMLCGCLCVAVDGTLCERKRGAALSDIEKRRYALEARIVTPWGWNIPIMSEPVEAYDGDREKQDCESRAFERLARRLKAAFPHQGFCIIGDALYACRPVMDICRANRWEFVLTFKEGVMPKVWDEVCQAQRRVGSSSFREMPDEDGKMCPVGVVAWVDARETAYENGTGYDFRVVKYSCWSASGGKYNGAFVTSLEVRDAGRALEVVSWGRRRWNIENGFKSEKHEGFGLEHTFCNDERAGRNYHVIMQIAYALWQVFATGVLSRLSDGRRKMTQVAWARVISTALHMIGFAAIPKPAVGAMRMRRFHLSAG